MHQTVGTNGAGKESEKSLLMARKKNPKPFRWGDPQSGHGPEKSVKPQVVVWKNSPKEDMKVRRVTYGHENQPSSGV